MKHNTDFEILTTEGNVGFYQSCEVTQLFIQHKGNQILDNLFILVSYEEKPFNSKNHHFLSRPLVISKDFSLGIQRYWLTMEEANLVFGKLSNEQKWDCNGDDRLRIGSLNGLAKQFVPADPENRLSHVLKNNFNNGSYILEFFDESKLHLSGLLALEKIEALDHLSEQIKKILPIDISLVRERLGNIIFQFPITILKVSSRRIPDHKGITVKFHWHSRILKPKICTIAVDSTLDGNYLGSVVMPYRGGSQKDIVTGHIDQITNIKVWSNNSRLLLSVFHGTYLSGLSTQTEIVSGEPRIFFIGDKEHRLKISGQGSAYGDSVKKDYATYIHNRLYEAEKTKLELSLSFKQYFVGDWIIALNDLRKLIQLYDQNGVYLWDPYLRSVDILNTLFYSRMANVPLRAIGAIEKGSKKVYGKSGSTAEQIIQQEFNSLSNPSNNNYGLSLEFRIQHGMHGWSFHDRFLIFPGGKDTKPKVYSLGTSLNSIGQSHHILQEVSHPQRVIDAFNELWRKLNHKDCLVWKSTKI